VIRHIIFDCDGVLVDSERLSMRADIELVARHGIVIGEEEAHHRFVGKTFQAMLDELSAEYRIALPSSLVADKDTLIEDMFRRELKGVPGITSALRALQGSGLTFSIASNSPGRRVVLALQLVGLADFFQAITTKDDVPNGKPSPDVFLRAVEGSGYGLSHCIAVEDSTTGMTAAVAAGLRTVGFTGTHPDPDVQGRRLLDLGAASIVHDMHQLPLALSELAN
jgi:HAD superfamily hydrolase (TIGR01509 family)